jgi:hypothetical protein
MEAMRPVVVKTPVPIMLATTVNVAGVKVRIRRSATDFYTALIM